MKVLIVAKTRMGNGACVGGITQDGTSVRLIAPDADDDKSFNMEYNVGEVWDVDFSHKEREEPHTEDVLVQRKERLGSLQDAAAIVMDRMPPKAGGIEALYDGLTQSTPSGALFVAARTGVPRYSTMFWLPDQPLHLDDQAKRIRYRYPTDDGGRTLTFVGFQPPRQTIPSHTLVRVSLAHWWRPRDEVDQELRCYLQISGWFLPEDDEGVTETVSTSTSLAPVDADIRQVLRTVFGYEEFRPWQEDIIQGLLDRQDVLVVMPTGGGKSLCYQLPALIFDGVTVVVSPLLSLMKDQVSQLKALGVSAVALNSTLDYSDYLESMHNIELGNVKLVYTSPETLLRQETIRLLERSKIELLAIDESHCISEWGHDFRPEYRELISIRNRFPQVSCIALTATATPRVQTDIADRLQMHGGLAFVTGFDRANLFLAVEPKVDGLAQTLNFISAHPQQSGIIYCATKKQVDQLAAELQARRLSVLPYHAGLDIATRQENQELFTRDDVQIMVATIAFGMGIDKSNVRFIVHYDLPDDLETYYQQIGRAGRDGLRADCLLLFGMGDVSTIRHFIQTGADSQRTPRQERLDRLIEWAESSMCRRYQLLTYFGEDDAPTHCEMCDNCVPSSVKTLRDNLTLQARDFLECVSLTKQMFGAHHIISVLRGSKAKKVLQYKHDQLPVYGVGSQLTKDEWLSLVDQFLEQRLTRHGPFRVLKLTSRGEAVLRGDQDVQGILDSMPEAPDQPAEAIESVSEYDDKLFELLRRLRKVLAEAADVPPYIVFSDRALTEMATYLPQSVEAFSAIHGVGSFKVERYAQIVVPVIQAYCANHQIREQCRALCIGEKTQNAAWSVTN